jgi:very-short-patch-repair endonuclease
MNHSRRNAIDSLASRQHGYLTRAQLQDLGIKRSTVLRWVRAGLLYQVGGRTFRLAGAPVTQRGIIAATCLEFDGVASHRSAAWLHDVDGHPGLIDVTTRHRPTRNRTQLARIDGVDVRVHSSTSLPQGDITAVYGIPVTSVARTILGVAALVPEEVTPRQLADLTGRAVDRRLARDPWLWWLLAQRRCRGRNGVLAMEQVLAERARLGPTESWLEREFLRILELHGVMLPKTQRVIRRAGRFAARVDFLFEDEDLVVEVLGYAFHRTPEQMAADLARANAIQLSGRRILQFVTSQVVQTPAMVARMVAEMLAGGRPAVAS